MILWHVVWNLWNTNRTSAYQAVSYSICMAQHFQLSVNLRRVLNVGRSVDVIIIDVIHYKQKEREELYDPMHRILPTRYLKTYKELLECCYWNAIHMICDDCYINLNSNDQEFYDKTVKHSICAAIHLARVTDCGFALYESLAHASSQHVLNVLWNILKWHLDERQYALSLVDETLK